LEFYLKWFLSFLIAEVIVESSHRGLGEATRDDACVKVPILVRRFVRAVGLVCVCFAWKFVRGDEWGLETRKLDVWGRWIVSVLNLLLYFDAIVVCVAIVMYIRVTTTRAECPMSVTPSPGILVLEAFVWPLVDLLREFLPVLDSVLQINKVTERLGLGMDFNPSFPLLPPPPSMPNDA